MSIQHIVEISHKYGADSEFVLAGGGNTSFKTSEFLFIKGSGTALATISEEGFVKMNRAALAEILTKQYPADEKTREAAVLADMMAARAVGQTGRPSVETLLHNSFDSPYVLHVHPATINGFTCGKNGKAFTEKALPDALWIESAKPGYTLAVLCAERMAEYKAAHGALPDVLILQNHGIFFAADSPAKLDKLVAGVMNTVRAAIKRSPELEPVDPEEAVAAVAADFAPRLRMTFGAPYTVRYCYNKEVAAFSESAEAFKPLTESFSPDHIVYCRAEPMFVESEEALTETFNKYVADYGYTPKIVFLRGVGMFACAKTPKDAAISETVFLDAIKIAVYSRSFGGAHYLGTKLTNFIKNWEVESYRSKVMASSSEAKRLAGKIAIVTGSAQGFGKGIAEAMLREGAYVVIADMNYTGACSLADELCEQYGTGRAIPVSVNVTDEASVLTMCRKTVFAYGGLDILVNNAGIVRAGGLPEMTKQNFELVTSVNYTAYFLCVKYATEIMRIQHEVCPTYMMDVIEINSKSGLAGSNKNFAYAGSKFGGIGLTQSFALELVAINVKVNAICPGNFLDGPLWSDPVKGLFVQYLNAGKVPGAKTVDDVRRAYESKVPLGRGCRTEDVARAIFYIVEQEYETGQAIPVTGGQEMLK